MIFSGPKTEEEINDFLKTRIESLGLSDNVEEFLLRSNIRTIGGLIRVDGSILYNTGDIENIINILSGVFDIKLIDDRKIKFIPKYYKIDKNEDNLNIEVKKQKYQDKFFTGPKTEDEINDFLKTRIESLELSKRTENSLLGSGIRTISGIIRKNNDGLHNINGMGSKGIEEIIKSLSYAFNIIVEDKNVKFIPKYYKESEKIIKEKTEEEKREEELKKIELNKIEELYFEKQEERDFIYETKISSLDLDFEVETLLLSNAFLSVGDILTSNIEDIKKKISVLGGDNVDLVLETLEFLVSKGKQAEQELDNIRNRALTLMGYLPLSLKNNNFHFETSKFLNQRNLNIFNSFRKGLTLEQIGVENNMTRERARQIILLTLDKMNLDYEEERRNIINKRKESRPQKIIKEKWWSRDYKECVSCNTTDYKHIRSGLCEKCAGHFIGENRDNIISEHNNKCDICGISRDEAKLLYGRDFYISKNMNVFCKGCHLSETGKKLSYHKINKWKKFYK